jgi:peptidoglycan/LPS O-acetylase OafA/YrhL
MEREIASAGNREARLVQGHPFQKGPLTGEANCMRIRELDGLRGIAVLAVLSDHYLSWLPAIGAQNGWLGVDLFFILSGFLITSILIGLRDKARYFSIFYERRALRIFPPYFLGIAVYLAASLLVGKPGTVSLWAQYIFYYTSLQVGQPPQLDYEVIMPVKLGLAVLWSLSVEELYYTFWAPIVRFTSHAGFTVILVGMIVAAPLLRWWLHTPLYPEMYTFYCRMDALAFGSVLALLMRERSKGALAWKRWDTRFNIAAITLTIATILLWIYLHGDRSRLLLMTAGVTMADLSFALITFAILRHAGGSSWWLRALRARWLRSVGMVSYSLYLFHYPLGYLIGHWVSHWGLSRHEAVVIQVLLSAAVSFAVAYALWYGMESRILRWKDRYVPSPAHP